MKLKLLFCAVISIYCDITFGQSSPLPPEFGRPPFSRPRPRPAPINTVAPEVELALPSYGGPGCPNGSVQAILSPDKSKLSVLFSQFQVQAGPAENKSTDVTQCSLVIPLEIQNGRYSALVTAVDYRGAASLPENSILNIIASYAMVDLSALIQRPTGLNRGEMQIVGPAEQDIIMSLATPPGSIGAVRPGQLRQWSICSQNPSLRISARLDLQNDNPSSEALATLDSLDASVKSSIEYRLLWRACP